MNCFEVTDRFHQANLNKPWNYTWKALVPLSEEREENMLNEIQSCNENAESRKKVFGHCFRTYSSIFNLLLLIVLG